MLHKSFTRLNDHLQETKEARFLRTGPLPHSNSNQLYTRPSNWRWLSN
jgi:hypothetical protein